MRAHLDRYSRRYAAENLDMCPRLDGKRARDLVAGGLLRRLPDHLRARLNGARSIRSAGLDGT